MTTHVPCVPRAGVEPAQPSLAKGFSYIRCRSFSVCLDYVLTVSRRT